MTTPDLLDAFWTGHTQALTAIAYLAGLTLVLGSHAAGVALLWRQGRIITRAARRTRPALWLRARISARRLHRAPT